VILRNITNYQDTKALNDFTNIEPYKVINATGWKKYFMYSPLTLFDACSADASMPMNLIKRSIRI
jgi:hexosaminidase